MNGLSIMLSLAAPCRRGLTCLLIWLGLAAAPAMATVQVLDRAQVTAASASTPPAAPGAERPLPDLWAQGADSQVHWYRVPLAPLDASQPQALAEGA